MNLCNFGTKGVQCKMGIIFMILDESWSNIFRMEVLCHVSLDGDFFLLGDFEIHLGYSFFWKFIGICNISQFIVVPLRGAPGMSMLAYLGSHLVGRSHLVATLDGRG